MSEMQTVYMRVMEYIDRLNAEGKPLAKEPVPLTRREADILGPMTAGSKAGPFSITTGCKMGGRFVVII